MVEGNSLDPDKPKIQIGELSMSRPEEFKQDFDWRYSKIAKHMSESDQNHLWTIEVSETDMIQRNSTR